MPSEGENEAVSPPEAHKSTFPTSSVDKNGESDNEKEKAEEAMDEEDKDAAAAAAAAEDNCPFSIVRCREFSLDEREEAVRSILILADAAEDGEPMRSVLPAAEVLAQWALHLSGRIPPREWLAVWDVEGEGKKKNGMGGDKDEGPVCVDVVGVCHEDFSATIQVLAREKRIFSSW